MQTVPPSACFAKFAESATLGMLVCMLFAPDLPVFAKMGISATTAMAGTALFMAVLTLSARPMGAWLAPLDTAPDAPE